MEIDSFDVTVGDSLTHAPAGRSDRGAALPAPPAPPAPPAIPDLPLAAASKRPPPPSPPPTGAPDEEGEIAVEQVRKTQRPRRYKVVFHNDDYTTREFVVDVLIRYFNKDESEATFIMLSVHHKGHGVAGVFPKDVAETKVDQVTKHARANGFPLKLTAEPE